MKYETSFIPDEHLPSQPGLKVIRINDPDYGLTEDEIQDRLEFIRCYLLKEFEVLLLIPIRTCDNDFFVHDITTADPEYSAFHTVDFHRQRRPFDKYAFAIRKIMERIKDLAIMHSCISHPADRADIRRRYENYLDDQFRDRLAVLIVWYRNCACPEKRSQLKRKIAEINCRILDARNIWARYAPPEHWGR